MVWDYYWSCHKIVDAKCNSDWQKMFKIHRASATSASFSSTHVPVRDHREEERPKKEEEEKEEAGRKQKWKSHWCHASDVTPRRWPRTNRPATTTRKGGMPDLRLHSQFAEKGIAHNRHADCADRSTRTYVHTYIYVLVRELVFSWLRTGGRIDDWFAAASQICHGVLVFDVSAMIRSVRLWNNDTT